MNYSSLKSDIAAVVKQNGNQEITGENLQGVLTEMIDNSVGTGYLYKGIATPETQGGTPDQNVFYLAGAGTYGNFGTSVPEGCVGIFKYNGTWSFDFIPIAIENINVLQKSIKTNNTIINADGSLSSNNGYNIYEYKNVGVQYIYGNASGYRDYLKVAFYNDTPSASSFLSGVLVTTSYTLESFSLPVPTGCNYIVICEAKNVLDTTCFGYIPLYEKINALLPVIDKVDNLDAELNALVTITPATTKDVDTDFTLDGYYSDTSTNIVSGYDFISCPLLRVIENSVIYLHNWKDYTANQGVLWFYDNDGQPYNGTNARVLSNALTRVSEGEYTYVVPANASQLGVSIDVRPDNARVQIGDTLYELTDVGKKMIENAIEGDENTGEKSANYYLKGESNIVYSTSKKLGIIAAGQSNIDGRNSYSDLPSGFVNPNSKVKFCNNTSGLFSDFQITDGGAGNDWSFDAIVYDALTNPSYGNQSEIYVMKKSMGSTSIDKDGATNYHWTADYEYLTNESYSLLRTFEKIIRKGEETQGENFDIKAFIWHQGEGDSATLAVAERYYDNLKNMLAYVRGVVGNPRLNFFCGTISENNHADPYKDIVNQAYWQLASEDPYFHVVDMSNAVLEDSWHFNYQWSIYFGQKVYDMMIDAGIVTGTKINPIEPV